MGGALALSRWQGVRHPRGDGDSGGWRQKHPFGYAAGAGPGEAGTVALLDEARAETAVLAGGRRQPLRVSEKIAERRSETVAAVATAKATVAGGSTAKAVVPFTSFPQLEAHPFPVFGASHCQMRLRTRVISWTVRHAPDETFLDEVPMVMLGLSHRGGEGQ